jgi:glycosyltransferase involved in cell wall biosynthesis
MKILVIAYLFPYPPDGGYKLRVYNTIKELSRNNKLDLLCFATEDYSQERQQHMRSYCQNVWVLKKPGMSIMKKLLRYSFDVFNNVPVSLFSAWDAEKIAFLKNIVSKNEYDVVVAEHLIAAHILYSTKLRLKKPILSVVVNHNVESELYKSIAFKKTPLLIPFLYIKFLSLKNYEKKVIASSNLSVTMSNIDQNVFKKMCTQTKFIALPNGVDTDLFYYRKEVPVNHDMYYAGSFNYYPNVDAIHFFMNDIFPAIKSRINDARFLIIGGSVPEEILRYHDGKQVFVLGYQNDLRSIMERCALSVVPLRLGGGTRLKIVEAMSMGIPVVSTSKGAEGLEVEDGQNIIIADDAGEFSKKLIKLLMNSEKLIELAREGRSLVERKYGWSVLIDKLQVELERLAQ